MEILGVTYNEKAKAGEALLKACYHLSKGRTLTAGNYQGFSMSLHMNTLNKNITISLKGSMSYTTDLGDDVHGNLTRINNMLASIPVKIEVSQFRILNIEKQIDSAKLELQKPFEFEAEFNEKTARQALVEAQLNIDANQVVDVVAGDGADKLDAGEVLVKKPSARAQLEAFNRKIKSEQEHSVAEKPAIGRSETEI